MTTILVESTDNDTLHISWEPPVTPNGTITSYSISFINLKDGSAVQESIHVEIHNFSRTDLGMFLTAAHNAQNGVPVIFTLRHRCNIISDRQYQHPYYNIGHSSYYLTISISSPQSDLQYHIEYTRSIWGKV